MPHNKKLTQICLSEGGFGKHRGVTTEHEKGVDRGVGSPVRKAGKKEKSNMLDEFVRHTGYNRKYALHLLTRWGKETFFTVDGKPVKLKAGTTTRRKGGGRKPVYGPEVTASLRAIRAFFWYPCGRTEGPQLLAPLMREQMAFFEDWKPFRITADIRDKLLTISPATIDRALKGDRKKLALKGISGTKPGKLLKKHIPVRTHYPWNERKRQTSLLGFFEIDTGRL
jgi:hypothetical protein